MAFQYDGNATGGVVLAGASGVASFALTALVRRYALRKNILDQPNLRSSHVTPTPRGGGLAIIAASILGMGVGVGVHSVSAHDALTLSVGILAMGAIGWMDDVRSVHALVRLAVHIAVAVWTLMMFGGLPTLQLGNGVVPIGWTGYVLGAVGIVWSINLFNFMDGIDGIAGSQATLIFGSAAALLLAAGDASFGTIAAILCASSAGFLVWNWPPAKIFLGDSGSGAIGYAVAGLAIGSENHHTVPLLFYAIAGGVFVVDASVTLARRIVRGERPMEAHREHAYQRLTRQWNSHRRVTIGAAGLTALLAALGAIGTLRPSLMLAMAGLAAALLAGVLFFVERDVPMAASSRNRVEL